MSAPTRLRTYMYALIVGPAFNFAFAPDQPSPVSPTELAASE